MDMEKVEDFRDEVTGYYYKGYKNDNISNKQFVQQLKEYDTNIGMAWITEMVDRDLKNVSGNYDVDYIIENYDAILSKASSAGTLHFSFFGSNQGRDYTIFVYPREENVVYLQTEDASLELTDILQKKNEIEKGRSL